MRNIIRISNDVRRRQSMTGSDGRAPVQRKDSLPHLSHQLSIGALREPAAPPHPPSPVNRLYRQHTQIHPRNSKRSMSHQNIHASKRATNVNTTLFIPDSQDSPVDCDMDSLSSSYGSSSIVSNRFRRAAFARRASRSRMSSDSADTDDGASISYVSVTVVLLIVIGSLLIVLLLAYFPKS